MKVYIIVRHFRDADNEICDVYSNANTASRIAEKYRKEEGLTYTVECWEIVDGNE